MASVTNIRGEDVVVFIDDNPVTGCFEYGLQSDLQLEQAKHLGDQQSTGVLKLPDQTHKLSLGWVLGPKSADQFLSPRSNNGNEFYSSGKHNIIVRDPTEQQLISGSYVTEFGIEASVGNPPSFRVSFDCDTVDINTETLTAKGTDTLTGTREIYRYQDIEVSNILAHPLIHFNSGCIQSINIVGTIPRTPVTRLGNRIPTNRVIKGDGFVDVTVGVLKNKEKNMPANYLNQIGNTIGELNLFVNTDNSYNITVKNLTLKSINESLGDAENEIIQYNFNGMLNSGSFWIEES